MCRWNPSERAKEQLNINNQRSSVSEKKSSHVYIYSQLYSTHLLNICLKAKYFNLFTG